MYRRISALVSDRSDDLAPLDSYDLRERRWVNTIERIDATITPESLNVSDTTSSTNLIELRRQRDAVSANNVNQVDDYYSVLFAPGLQSNASHGLTSSRHVISRKPLRQWFRQFYESTGSTGEVAETKRYFERCVELLQSLVLKMIVTDVKDGVAEMNVVVDPRFITIENLEVYYSVDWKETLHFICSDVDAYDSSSCDLNTKYAAMKALGMVAYELLMKGGGPPIQSFLPSTMITSEGTPRLLLSLDDYDDKTEGDRNQAKRQRASCANKQSRISAVMIKAGVPYPLCRFVVGKYYFYDIYLCSFLCYSY